MYLAQMLWCEREEPICAGLNKKLVKKEALRILKEEHGTGRVCRGMALCHEKITYNDIEIVEIPII